MNNKTTTFGSNTAMRYVSLILVVLVITDGIITNLLIKHDIAHEGNPFLQVIAGGNSFLLLKLAGAILCVLLLWDIYRHWRKLAFVTTCCFVVVYSGINIWNLALLVNGLG